MGLKGRKSAVREIFAWLDRHQFRPAIRSGRQPALHPSLKTKNSGKPEFFNRRACLLTLLIQQHSQASLLQHLHQPALLRLRHLP